MTDIGRDDVNVTEEDSVDVQEDFTYIKTPSGVEKVPTRWLEDQIANQAGPSNAAKAPTPPAEEPSFFVHLADGTVETVKESELPGAAGTNAPYGFYDRNGKSVLITAVHPA